MEQLYEFALACFFWLAIPLAVASAAIRGPRRRRR